MRFKRFLALGLVLGMSVLTVGCSKENSSNQDANSSATEVVEETNDTSDKQDKSAE